MTPNERELLLLTAACTHARPGTLARMLDLSSCVKAEAGAQPVEPTEPTAVAFETTWQRAIAAEHARHYSDLMSTLFGRKVRVTIEPV